MKSNLKEKVAVITGGGGILCGTIAKGLAKEGVKIAILDISLDKARTVTDEILKEGGDALAIKCDVLNKEEVKSAKEKVIEKYGKCDILINGAGGNHPKGTTTKEHFFNCFSRLYSIGSSNLRPFIRRYSSLPDDCIIVRLIIRSIFSLHS
jgi:NAD(P)-dependent dehydrogenase (short-subunit alcohol dehydrogenase family)